MLEACRAARIDAPADFHCLRHTWVSHRVCAECHSSPWLRCSGTRIGAWSKHYGHLAPSFVRDAVWTTAMNLGPHKTVKVSRLRLSSGSIAG
jgi:hypothetical protein